MDKASMINTKIICTIGPISQSYDMLKQMYHAGMSIARLNMSHGTHESHGKIIKHIQRLNREVNFPIGIMLDTKGPEIRTGDADLELTPGETIEISVDPDDQYQKSRLYIAYPDLIKTTKTGQKITIDNGLINLEILKKSKTTMRCRVIDGGFIKGRRHVNLPGVHLNLPNITEKDRSDILFGLDQGIDFIALSFVRNAETVKELRQIMADKRKEVKIIAKIENQEGVKNLEEILDVVDGIMVARGDLGVEIEIEDLPHIQRQIAALCGEHGKRLIIATHLLESMIDNPIPTRAEVTDVTNAVYEDADAVMLSGETTVGKYPLKCLEVIQKMAQRTENYPGVGFAKRKLIATAKKQHIMTSAVRLAQGLEHKSMLVLTKTGKTANYVANNRPFDIKIFAFSDDKKTTQHLSLSRGVYPFFVRFYNDPEKTIQSAFQILKEHRVVKSGDQIVVASDINVKGKSVEAIQVRFIP